MIALLKIILSLSLSGTLLILVLLLCKPLVKNKLSKRWQYYIWLIVVARLLLPFAPETNLMGTLFQHFDNSVIQTNENLQSQQSYSKLPETDFADNDKQTGTTDGVYIKPENQLPNIFNMAWKNIGAIYLLIWCIVAVGLMIRKVTIYQSFVKYIKAGRIEISDMQLWERVGKLVEQTSIKGAVGLYTNSLISSPLLIGFIQPCIMLPTTELSDSDFQNTILHELTHYKRRDMFYKWLVQFTVCLHWFNPLVYLMGREVNRACELSCDEAAVRTLDPKERRAYGDTLLNAMGAGGSYKDSLASVTLYGSTKLLKERLDAIMGFKRTTRITAAISIALVLIFCFGAMAAGAYAVTPQANQNGIVSPSPTVKSATPQISPVSGEKTTFDSSVISLLSNGQESITQSGSFESKKNQLLILTVKSNIQGGVVDFFLFSPNGKEQRFTFTGLDKTETIELSVGRWAYVCTGFFQSGEFSVLGNLKNSEDIPSNSSAISLDTRALELMQKTGNWGYIEPYLPKLTNAGIDAVVSCYNSKHFNPSEFKIASNYYNQPISMAPFTTEEADKRGQEIIEFSGTWGQTMEEVLPYMSNEGIDEAVKIYNQKHSSGHKIASDYYGSTPVTSAPTEPKGTGFDYSVFNRLDTMTSAEADALALSYIAATGQFGHIYNLRPYMTTTGIDAAVKAYLDVDGDVGVVLAMLPYMSEAVAKKVKAQAVNEW